MPSASGDASAEWNSSKNFPGIIAVSLLKYHGKPLLISPLVSCLNSNARTDEKYECSNRRLLPYFAIRQQPADIQDNSPADSHTTYTSYLPRTFDNPLPYSAHTIPYAVSDSNEIAGVTVVAPRRSTSAISRFNSSVGWLSITERLAWQAAKSVAFCVPDSNTLCSRDDLCSTM
jgi:hypothetical protein